MSLSVCYGQTAFFSVLSQKPNVALSKRTQLCRQNQSFTWELLISRCLNLFVSFVSLRAFVECGLSFKNTVVTQ